MTSSIRRINPGEPITADWLNGLLAGLERLSGQSQGGVRLDAATLSAVVQQVLATIDPDNEPRVIITAVYQPPAGPGPMDSIATPNGLASWPSTVFYDYIGFKRGGISGTMAAPAFGRPVKGNESRVYPAPVGSLAVVLRHPDAAGVVTPRFGFRWDREVVARRLCGS